ncbi:Transposon Ty3-I Gag-Pol polyprotein, partial [Aphis craccivora]
MTELMNKIICNSLTHYVNKNQKDWILYYKLVVFAYNTCPRSRLKVSPFFLLHGIDANQPLDNKIKPNIDNFNLAKSLETLQKIREKIPNTIRKKQQTQKLNYDKTHKTVSYLPGQKISDVNCEIELILNGKLTTDVIHVQRIKPFTDKKKHIQTKVGGKNPEKRLECWQVGVSELEKTRSRRHPRALGT